MATSRTPPRRRRSPPSPPHARQPAATSSSAPSTRTRRSTRRRGCSGWTCARRRPTTSSACGSTSEDAESLSEYGPSLGRRFRSLKLWAILRCYGREGLQARIREAVRLAELFERWVRDEPGWEVCAPRHFSLVCFRHEGDDAHNEAIVDRANRSGELFLSHTRLNGRYVLRLAIGNERTTEADVRRAWDALRAAS